MMKFLFKKLRKKLFFEKNYIFLALKSEKIFFACNCSQGTPVDAEMNQESESAKKTGKFADFSH